mmetsp:Transcript_32155/g.92316  ORF Transcript_32155/g.92316 Transcript_32155/m.92316 type:complete len:217 (+) Transcript_32155:196-846(+)
MTSLAFSSVTLLVRFLGALTEDLLSASSASLNASAEKSRRFASSLSSTSSSMCEARRTRSMTASSVRSATPMTSRTQETGTNSPSAFSIAVRAAASRPRATAPARSPTAKTSTCFVRRSRPSPKFMRRRPARASLSLLAMHSFISMMEPMPPSTKGNVFGSGFTITQFQGPTGSPTALSASRPVENSAVDSCAGMRLPLFSLPRFDLFEASVICSS